MSFMVNFTHINFTASASSFYLFSQSYTREQVALSPVATNGETQQQQQQKMYEMKK